MVHVKLSIQYVYPRVNRTSTLLLTYPGRTSPPESCIPMAGLSHELRLILRRRRSRIALRIHRRKPLTVRLGGGSCSGCNYLKDGFFSRAIHLMRHQWVFGKWRLAAARMAALYTELKKDVTEGRSAMEAFHAKLAMESYFAIPSMPALHLVKKSHLFTN